MHSFHMLVVSIFPFHEKGNKLPAR